MKGDNRKKLRSKFNSKDEVWRIEAVIHDGNWYDIEKWAKVARVKDRQVLLDWIKKNEDILIKSEQNSYRVGHDEIVKWYEKEGLDIEESIVPNNFPPRLWGGMTETDIFLNAPRRRVGTVNFQADSDELLARCTEILKGTGKIMPDTNGKYRAYGLSAAHMRNLLSKGLTEEEFDSLDLKTRAILLQRELTDLPTEWLSKTIDFYTNTFAPSVLKSAMSTISIYLPDRNDIRSQTVIWVIAALKKFDESASVPFPGYLSSVLRHWPYDLPDEHLGKDLARFQREKKRAINLVLKDGYEGENIPIDKLAEVMDIDITDYVSLNNEHENWLAEKNATTLTWEDSANEKKGQMVGYEETQDSDVQELFKMSLSTVKTAIDTGEWDLAYKIISQIDSNEIDEDLNSKLTPEFLSVLGSYLGMS